jgi:hypothetical protein
MPGAEPDADRSEADFLFHVYRGSELLHDGHLLEAQTELEHALTIVPSDPRTEGLLAAAYFRSGLCTRAITMYRALLDDNPDDPTLRLNVALCHLKMGQSEDARLELEALAAQDVHNARVWGYLAVALERLGFVDQAREAFERAGQPDLARRMIERGASRPRLTVPPGAHHGDAKEGVSPPASPTFEALDAEEFSLGLLDSIRPEGEVGLVARVPAPPARPRLDTLRWGAEPLDVPQTRTWLEAPPLTNLIEDARVDRAGGVQRVVVLATRLARIDLDAESSPRGFAFRLEALRSYTGSLAPDVLPRKMRVEAEAPQETLGEIFGGVGAPFASMNAPGQLLLGPRPAHGLRAFELRNDVVFFREEALLGFDLSLDYENGRLALGSSSAEVAPLVQLRGGGVVLVEFATDLVALEVKGGNLVARKELIVGWVGRLLPRGLSAGEAPCGQRGLIGFSGEGTVLVSTK